MPFADPHTKRPLARALAYVWLAAPAVSFAFSAVLGAAVAAAEDWDWSDGFFYVGSFAAHTTAALTAKKPQTKAGQWLAVAAAAWSLGVLALGFAVVLSAVLKSAGQKRAFPRQAPVLGRCLSPFLLTPAAVFGLAIMFSGSGGAGEQCFWFALSLLSGTDGDVCDSSPGGGSCCWMTTREAVEVVLVLLHPGLLAMVLAVPVAALRGPYQPEKDDPPPPPPCPSPFEPSQEAAG
eukprot:TRINITY_DN9129_c0_g8_i1.p1 TRINITY_DN9129_c0_g8~~TRINITY_DN9129_c0_g8_i1.p1  ORF type:complete len:235 (+),score=54.40 TRINITY_DN9129_c0_g8_i1:119-823(+)